MSGPDLDLCIVFVCQHGALEFKSCILAASIRYHFGDAVELIAAVPVPAEQWGAPAESTIDYLESIGVRIKQIRNAVGRHYPIGNKLLCLDIPTKKKRICFIDTDVICLNSGDISELTESRDVLFVPATYKHVENNEWEYLYREFETDLPTETYQLLASKAKGHPYANSGFVVADANSGIGELWCEGVKKVQKDDSVRETIKYPYADQVALPLVLLKNRIPFAFIHFKWNYPAWLWRTDRKSMPVFFHYQSAYRIAADLHAFRMFLRIVDSSKPLRTLIGSSPEFGLLFTGTRFRLVKSAIKTYLPFVERLIVGTLARRETRRC